MQPDRHSCDTVTEQNNPTLWWQTHQTGSVGFRVIKPLSCYEKKKSFQFSPTIQIKKKKRKPTEKLCLNSARDFFTAVKQPQSIISTTSGAIIPHISTRNRFNFHPLTVRWVFNGSTYRAGLTLGYSHIHSYHANKVVTAGEAIQAKSDYMYPSNIYYSLHCTIPITYSIYSVCCLWHAELMPYSAQCRPAATLLTAVLLLKWPEFFIQMPCTCQLSQ